MKRTLDFFSEQDEITRMIHNKRSKFKTHHEVHPISSGNAKKLLFEKGKLSKIMNSLSVGLMLHEALHSKYLYRNVQNGNRIGSFGISLSFVSELEKPQFFGDGCFCNDGCDEEPCQDPNNIFFVSELWQNGNPYVSKECERSTNFKKNEEEEEKMETEFAKCRPSFLSSKQTSLNYESEFQKIFGASVFKSSQNKMILMRMIQTDIDTRENSEFDKIREFKDFTNFCETDRGVFITSPDHWCLDGRVQFWIDKKFLRFVEFVEIFEKTNNSDLYFRNSKTIDHFEKNSTDLFLGESSDERFKFYVTVVESMAQCICDYSRVLNCRFVKESLRPEKIGCLKDVARGYLKKNTRNSEKWCADFHFDDRDGRRWSVEVFSDDVHDFDSGELKYMNCIVNELAKSEVQKSCQCTERDVVFVESLRHDRVAILIVG